MAATTRILRTTKHTTNTIVTARSKLPAAPPTTQQTSQQRRSQSTKRQLHSTSQKDVSMPLPSGEEAVARVSAGGGGISENSTMTPLACLPLSQVLRSYLITTMSSSPTLLAASTNLLRKMLDSSNPLFSLDKNPVMRMILWETFYKQFCAGTNAEQVAQRTAELREMGYSGVILEYARELLKDSDSDEAADVATWQKGALDSISIAAPGDFLGLKWSGMGSAALRRMAKEQEPSVEMSRAMHNVAAAAAEKDVALLPSAEETWNLPGYMKWTMDMQREYNTKGKSVVYSTYQMYLKQMPTLIARDLEVAKAEGITLGVKFVRGAYLASEKRSLIHDTIEQTHHAYDSVTSAMIHRTYNDFLRPSTTQQISFPTTNVVLASHNATTVHKAQTLRTLQALRGEPLTPLIFAQLQGMADEVSCGIIAASREPLAPVREKVHKCLAWGSMYECLNYLLRRAAENRDAAGRTGETRGAMGRELGRRLRGVVGL